MGVFASFFPFIFLAVGALVLNVVMVRLVEQQRLVIGTLKALGYGDGQLFLHFTKLGLVVGLVGGSVGLVLGNFMGGVITGIYRMFYEFPNLENRVYPGLYATGMAISVIFSIIGAWHGALCGHAAQSGRSNAGQTTGRGRGGVARAVSAPLEPARFRLAADGAQCAPQSVAHRRWVFSRRPRARRCSCAASCSMRRCIIW